MISLTFRDYILRQNRHLKPIAVVVFQIAAINILLVASSANAAEAQTWGLNDSGQLGDGNTATSRYPVTVFGMLTGVDDVAAGTEHSLAIQNGGAFAWGSDLNFQLGDASLASSTTPVPVAGLSTGVTAVAAGQSFSLAIMNGQVFGWGFNSDGETGTGTMFYPVVVPTAVMGLSNNVSAIAAGRMHGVALRSGTVFCWGSNSYGQLGNGLTTSSDVPVEVGGLAGGVTVIAGGGYHTLAICNGGVYSWGSNIDGQLGDGMLTNSNVPMPVAALSSHVTAVAGGLAHTLAVMNGNVYAWGLNANGQLGDGSTINRNIPEEIDSAVLDDIVAVTASYDSSFALASDGSLWVWGDNSYGELGLGSSAGDFLTPQHLLPPPGYVFTSIDANPDGQHAVATLVPVPEPASISILVVAIAILGRKGDRK